MIGSGAGLFVFLFIVCIVVLMSFFDAQRGGGPAGKNQWADMIFALFIGAVMPIGGAFMILGIGGLLLRRIGASSPAECWPANEPLAELDPSD